jgi:hypothetical protein
MMVRSPRRRSRGVEGSRSRRSDLVLVEEARLLLKLVEVGKARVRSQPALATFARARRSQLGGWLLYLSRKRVIYAAGSLPALATVLCLSRKQGADEAGARLGVASDR